MSRSNMPVIIVAVATVLGVVVIGLFVAGGNRTTLLAIAVGVLAVAILGTAAWILVSRLGNGRQKVEREVDAQRLGFSYTEKGDKAFRARFADLKAVPRGASIRHIYEGSLDGRPLVVFQSTYTVSTGQSMIQVAHTIYAVDIPAWPSTLVAGRNWFGRLLRKLGRSTGLQLDDPEFNLRLRLKTDDEDFAIALLSPEMQTFMLTKTSVKWRITPGRLCLIYSGTLRADRIEASLDRLRQFWELVPAELESW